MKKYIIILLLALPFAAFSSFTNSDREILTIDGLGALGIDFGVVPVGATITRSTMIVNNGSTEITMNSLTIKGADSADFIYENNILFPYVIRPGEAIQISFRFSSTIPKYYQAQVEIDYNDPNSPCVFFITANSIVSVGEQTDFINSIYPNPAADYIKIELGNVIPAEAGIQVRIYDILGVLQLPRPDGHPFELEGEKIRLDVSNLAPGLYFVGVGDFVGKFVKY